MFFFFFKQKTAYEVRISDWSSDVCSSDLAAPVGPGLILVVDDEAPVRALTQEILQANGYRVETAESGAQALRMLEHETYSLVVTDLRMPGVSEIGRASCRERVCQYV